MIDGTGASPQRLSGILMMVAVMLADNRAVAGNRPTALGAAENTVVGDKVEQRTGSRTEHRY